MTYLETKAQLIERIKTALEKDGIFKIMTYPSNGYGWNEDEHYAMIDLSDHPDTVPGKIHSTVRFKTWEWVVFKKGD